MKKREQLFHFGCKALMIHPEAKVLLLRNDHKDPAKQYWDLPGGRIQEGEEQEETLHREIYEETQIRSYTTPKLLCYTPTNFYARDQTDVIRIFIALYECYLLEAQEPILSPDHKSYSWMEFEEAANTLKPTYPEICVQKLREISV